MPTRVQTPQASHFKQWLCAALFIVQTNSRFNQKCTKGSVACRCVKNTIEYVLCSSSYFRFAVHLSPATVNLTQIVFLKWLWSDWETWSYLYLMCMRNLRKYRIVKWSVYAHYKKTLNFDLGSWGLKTGEEPHAAREPRVGHPWVLISFTCLKRSGSVGFVVLAKIRPKK